MQKKNIVHYIITFFLYLLAQVVFFKNIALFEVAFCYIYLSFILLLPVNTPKTSLLLIGFALGFAVDIFYDTLGIHAAACVLVAFFRQPIIKLVEPTGGFDPGSRPDVKELGISKFFTYCLIMVLIHHFLMFFISSSNLSYWNWTLLYIFASTICTSVFIVLIQQLKGIYYRSRR
ncbi:rod shape-determining protein MreD [Flexithrix dorotheae]|uniref:rod shape-determining protein MreD n=1 Tax=Flexithrix dorotheae TaxID=70993 RepID=UPI000370499E|nr:rod shape-determining protein MreD [Flexithrix dorotheae]